MRESVDEVVIKAGKDMKNERQRIGVNISYTIHDGKVKLGIGVHSGIEPGMAVDVITIMKKYLIEQKRYDLLDPSDRSY